MKISYRFLFPIHLTTIIHRILCEGGANVNARNAVLDTPLLDAVKRGDPEIVESLLKYGADVSLSNAKVRITN